MTTPSQKVTSKPTLNSKREKTFVGISLFNDVRYYQENSWSFVELVPGGGAGHCPNLETLATFIYRLRDNEITFDKVPEPEEPRGLVKRWYVKLPDEWKKELLALVEKKRADLTPTNRSGV